jgi:hypothetical protein
VAAALRPDNTAAMETAAAGSAVTTTIERATTGGLRATADDYVVNLGAAARTLDAAAADGTGPNAGTGEDGGDADAAQADDHTTTDTNTDT